MSLIKTRYPLLRTVSAQETGKDPNMTEKLLTGHNASTQSSKQIFDMVPNILSFINYQNYRRSLLEISNQYTTDISL